MPRRASASGRLARTTFVLAVALLLALVAEPGHAVGPATGPAVLPARAANDLGAVRAEGVTLTDALESYGQANAYTFRVADGPGSVQVYVGDLWYDVDVLLLRGAVLPDDRGQWRSLACGSGCLASAPASARRRVQFVEPKGLIESVENGTYAIVVRPRDEATFGAGRPFTLRVVVTPPVCAVSDAAAGYRLALAMTPASPGRADLVVLTAYVLPPFGDLFDFEWSVDGRPLPSSGAATQMPAFELAGGRSGSHDVRVTARGIKPYPDPDQAEIPPGLSAGCALSLT
jgi:hypothetical protein